MNDPISKNPRPARLWVTLRVQGQLKPEQWQGWFGDMSIEAGEGLGETVLSGAVADQAELYGLLARLRNLGLGLLALNTSAPPGGTT